MVADDGLSLEEERTAQLVDALKRSGDLRPLINVIRGEANGPTRARAALLLLGELDLELLVQVALHSLIRDHAADLHKAVQGTGPCGFEQT